ncbi:MAG: endonuclease/exonuclease/phosphatase family protein [Chloroflexi bacterium]|nr:endonuclease/exonuclease/phosphatase family protein [Chloroflexota bacterium]MBI3732404.1 endonuclease/exonuclease/phosphatase family protein [Chloroflexota bacterium]
MLMRLMTYNIKSGRYHADGLEAIARVLEAQSPDIVGLQEVDEGTTRSGSVAQTDWLARRLRMNGVFASAIAFDGGSYGLALLSRYPIQSHQKRLLFRPTYPDAAVRPRHDSEQRVVLTASSGPLTITVSHLGLTPDQRAVQAQELYDTACQSGEPMVIMGDFNCEPDAPELAVLRARFQDACAVCGVRGDDRFTFPSGLRGARCDDGWRGAIDHVWASRGVQIISARVVMDTSRASDHQPLLVECEV